MCIGHSLSLWSGESTARPPAPSAPFSVPDHPACNNNNNNNTNANNSNNNNDHNNNKQQQQQPQQQNNNDYTFQSGD
jgi:hypothetical protein